MNDYKKGGGDKKQLYDTENGQYTRNPLCEKDEENLVLSKTFGLETRKPIAYPDIKIHDRDYCELLIAYGLDLRDPFIDNRKITEYLLIKQPSRDKSEFLKHIGYTLNNPDDLYWAIIDGTSFRHKRLSKFTEKSLTFETETVIKDLIRGRNIKLASIWFIRKDFGVNFVTLLLEEFKYEKN